VNGPVDEISDWRRRMSSHGARLWRGASRICLFVGTLAGAVQLAVGKVRGPWAVECVRRSLWALLVVAISCTSVGCGGHGASGCCCGEEAARHVRARVQKGVEALRRGDFRAYVNLYATEALPYLAFALVRRLNEDVGVGRRWASESEVRVTESLLDRIEQTCGVRRSEISEWPPPEDPGSVFPVDRSDIRVEAAANRLRRIAASESHKAKAGGPPAGGLLAWQATQELMISPDGRRAQFGHLGIRLQLVCDHGTWYFDVPSPLHGSR
jgi:hypothetical protein